uniref:Bromodomain adjacent to zinc finger domain 2B n=1 Tax=Junco hyemalis TaxID=40217 RepID=A0A8C5J5B6_JUNHY
MESGERLTSSSVSSTTAASTPASSTPSVTSEVSKGGLSSGAATLSSTINTCGKNDSSLYCNVIVVFVSTSLVLPLRPHCCSLLPCLSPPPLPLKRAGEWWRTADTHSRPGAAFFPPLLGIPTLFAPPAQNHDSPSFHSRATGKSSRSNTDKGMNGSLNGNSTSAVSALSTSVLSTSIATSAGPVKNVTSGAGGRKYNQEQSKVQLLDTRADKIKDKKPRKKTVESSSNSDSDSGSSSDTSSEGVSSSDSEDLEEDEEEEEEDQSAEESEDDESDSENEAHHKSKNKVLMHSGVTDAKTDGQKSQDKSQEKRTHQQIPLVSDSQTHSSFQSQQKQPQVLSQQLPFIFQSSQAKEESVNKHTSVIQSTGLVPNVKPLSLVHEAKKETYLKLIVPSPDLLKAGNKNTSEESITLTSDVRSKREQYKQTFPAQLKKQESSKSLKKVIAALSSPKPTSSSPAHQKLTSLENNHSNPFLTNALLGNHQPNGVIQSVIQEAPLALTTKPKPQTKINESVAISSSAPFSLPINLSACGKKPTGNRTAVMPSTSPVLPGSGKDKAVSNNAVNAVKPQHRLHSAKLVVEQFRGVDSDAPSSKDSDDSNDDDDDDEDEDEDDEEDDSDDSQSESDSNSESDTEGSEEEDDEDDKDQDESDTDTEGEKAPLKLNKTASSVKSSSIGLTAHSAPLNLQVAKTSSSAPAALCPESQPAVFLGTGASTLTPSTHCGISKRRRVADERELRVPLDYGWQRETRIRNFGGRLQGEVAYFAPCGKKLRQYPEVVKYLSRNGIMDISRDNFSFSAKIGVGDFYEARDGPQGVQWCLLKEEEVIPRIRAMEGRRGRPPNADRQHSREEPRSRRRKGRPPNVGSGEFLDSADTKLLRKLQAQEIARQAAQIKLLRKLQKQEQARAAKEAKKQQAIMAAEEKRKQKEQIKIMKQQVNYAIAKKKKKEEAANAKLLEAEKRIKERERRRQHMMLMKAMEARKKAEEKERLKQEKRDEKRLNKERKLEQRRLELEMAKELKKPNEDMCLADQKPFPELPRIPGLVLDGSTFSDCLMVVQFLRNFGKVLGFDVAIDVPSLSVLQEGLLNIGDSMGEVQDLLVKLVSAAVCDPGLGTGYKAKTILGEHLLNVGINRDNVSEILQIFMEAHCGQTELTESLKTKAFQAHSPAQKASVLAFLVNELACSKSVVSEIDKNIDYMSNLRRDKWMVEGKLRKLRIIHAKKTGKRDAAGSGDGGEEPHSLETPAPGRKRRRKGGDSDYDDDDDDDSDDQADEDDEDEEDKDDKKGKKAEVCEDEVGNCLILYF